MPQALCMYLIQLTTLVLIMSHSLHPDPKRQTNMDAEEDAEERQDDSSELLGLVGPPSTTTKRSGSGSGSRDWTGSGAGADEDDVKAVFAHVDLDAFYAQVTSAPSWLAYFLLLF